MKITVFNGSPQASKSSTNIIVEAFLEGARRGGAETENIFLIEKNIKHCMGCFSCWFKQPGICIHKDEMNELLKKYQESDLVCFATPVYTWNMTASMKNFVDRLVPLKSPLLVNKNGNFDLKDSQAKTQQFMVISNSGFPGSQNFEIMKEVFKPCHPVLEIYRNSGKLLKSKDLKYQKIVSEYLEVVQQVGYEWVTKRNLSEETKLNLNKDLVTIEEYVKFLGM